MKYTLARFTVKPEYLKGTRLALAELIVEVRKNQPRTLYTVFRTDTPETFVALMGFENEAAEKRHSQSKYIAEFARKILPWCDGKPLFRELAIFGSSLKQWLLEAEPFAADQLPGLYAGQRHDGQQRVAQDMAAHDPALGRTFGASGTHEILAGHFQHGRPREPGIDGHIKQPKREGRQHQIRRYVHHSRPAMQRHTHRPHPE